MINLLIAIVALAAPGSPAAGHAAAHPASQPTTKPSTQPATARADETVVEDAKLHFRFAVPKAWKAVPQRPEAVWVFSLPAVGESRRVTPSLIVTARDLDERTLQSEADARRDAITERNAGVKFDENAAATIAGHEGWVFAYVTTLTQTVTEKPSGKQYKEKVAVQVRDQLVVIDGRAFEFVLTSDDKGLAIRRRMIDRVLQTLAVDPK